MNDIFSFKRFALLMKAHWKENRKRELWLLALLLLALSFRYINLLIFAVKTHTEMGAGLHYQNSYDYTKIFVFGAAYITICAAVFFKNFAKKESAMFALSTSASAFERISLAFLFTMIIYPVIFLLCAHLFDFFFLGIYTNIYDIQGTTFSLNEYSFNNYFGFFTILSVVIFGSVFFKKHGVPKSILILMAFFLLQLIIIDRMMPENAVFMGEFSDMILMEKGTGQRIIINGFMYYFKYLLFPLLWILTLLSLKEREV